MSEKLKPDERSKRIKNRLPLFLLAALLILPAFLYYSAQTGQQELNVALLGILALVMILIVLFA
ncbi:MAG: hypothetical protein IT308_08315 [Anaerolineaceae bacterium]|nr:hypothetical protein [Anaerolineaceae bacterium]